MHEYTIPTIQLGLILVVIIIGSIHKNFRNTLLHSLVYSGFYLFMLWIISNITQLRMDNFLLNLTFLTFLIPIIKKFRLNFPDAKDVLLKTYLPFLPFFLILFLESLIKINFNPPSDLLTHQKIIFSFASNNPIEIVDSMINGDYLYPFFPHLMLSNFCTTYENCGLLTLAIGSSIAYVFVPMLLILILNSSSKNYLASIVSLLVYLILDPIEKIISFGGLPYIFGFFFSLVYIYSLKINILRISKMGLIIYISMILLTLSFIHPVSIIFFLIIFTILFKSKYLIYSLTLPSLVFIMLSLVNPRFIEFLNNIQNSLESRTNSSYFRPPSSVYDVILRIWNIFDSYNFKSLFIIMLIVSTIAFIKKEYFIITTNVILVILIIATNSFSFNENTNEIIQFFTNPWMNESIRLMSQIAFFEIFFIYKLWTNIYTSNIFKKFNMLLLGLWKRKKKLLSLI